MKKTVLGFVVASMVFSTGVFAQPAPQAAPATVKQVQPAGQAEWVALMKMQGEERKALNEKLNAERDAFLKANPEVAARVEEQMKTARERAEARRAGMQKK